MHWTILLALIYSIIAIAFFIIRLRLQRINCPKSLELDEQRPRLTVRVKSRIGLASYFLLALAALSFYAAREYFEPSIQMHVEILGALLLTAGFFKMRVWPWSLGSIEAGPYGPKLVFKSALGTDKFTWVAFPKVKLGKRKVRFEGWPTRTAADRGEWKAMSISKWDIGGKEFAVFKLYLSRCFPWEIG